MVTGPAGGIPSRDIAALDIWEGRGVSKTRAGSRGRSCCRWPGPPRPRGRCEHAHQRGREWPEEAGPSGRCCAAGRTWAQPAPSRGSGREGHAGQK